MSAQAIIFDCFGVLTSEGWLPLRDEYFGMDPKLLKMVNDRMKQLTSDLINQEEFEKEVAELAGINRLVIHSRMDVNAPDSRLFSYIEDILKPKYKIAMLSNVGRDQLHKIFSLSQTELFDVMALSYETGLLKPDIQAFEDVAEKLEIVPRCCIFVDDQLHNVEGAIRAGMQGILYENFVQFQAELENKLTVTTGN
jgi:HAD superfamily hydrolase (TIGR01509 family)